ncbi:MULTISPECIES: SDR family NAD(P)-dependent oxidoreductase [Caproicibacterium]|uniref:SDR family NAD(P)-dependent oxidoreductase n=1 Tax=Caproicibacterium argilliputei TaxID=3030016 RepID=A0AA97DB84_9FIRM|nr:SDR family NAD(P)-dependent oxidoreductase [Caproicibacterium argilliputei]WOC32440.1 SDR family NAD(P)-dependent oxidoreductase [Caproicibacterium argilliputei]
MQIAIVTGASSGLGREFVRQISAQESLDEIWVLARRKNRLDELAEAVPATHVRPVPLDLTKQDDIRALRELLQKEAPDVRLLVNAAGFGKIGTYADISQRDCDDMIDLDCRAAVDTTMLALPYMRQGARILEICSTAGFQPLPGLGVYAASKAFLLRYSRALRWELFPRGIHVTAVCPYWVKDTEFIPTAKETKNDGAAVRHFPLASRSHSVVKWALWDSRANLAVSTPSPVSFLHRVTAKFIPHCVMIAVWELLRRV